MSLKILSFILMILTCTTQGCISDDDPEGPIIGIGDTLPQFSVNLTDGTTVTTQTFMGKVGVIVFFNTGCSDCREELPVIQQLWDYYKDNKDVVIALIARQESEKEINEYWEENGFTMPFSPQDTKEVYNLFAPSVIPRIFISDKHNVVRFSSGDTDMPDIELLKVTIESLLQQ